MSTLPLPTSRFDHPIVESGADPYVVIHEGSFYYCYVLENEKTQIYINRAEQLEDIGQSQPFTVWPITKGKPYSRNIWAPELHHLDGKWYIYFTAGDGPKKSEPFYPHQRMYVLESISDDPLGPYQMRGKVADAADQWAIDGTILEHPNGQRYCVWSGWEGTVEIDQRLYIARMLNPWTLEGTRVMISRPEHAWEIHGLPVNEGPQVLRQGNQIHIIYSASWSHTDDYCLGQLDLLGDDPLDPQSWVKHPKPIFEKSSKLAGTGHACFLLSDDGQYGWMVFHAARNAGSGWDRQVRLAAFSWNNQGELMFLRVDQDSLGMATRKKLRNILHWPGKRG